MTNYTPPTPPTPPRQLTIDTAHPGAQPRIPKMPEPSLEQHYKDFDIPLWARLLMGILDVLPIPNVHEIIRSLLKKEPITRTDIILLVKMTLTKFDVPRTTISIITGALMLLL